MSAPPADVPAMIAALLADADAAELLPTSVWCRIVRTGGSVNTLGSLDSIPTRHTSDRDTAHDTTLEALRG